MKGLIVALLLIGCGDTASGPALCAPIERSEPLSIERARAEHRHLERRRHLRMKEALTPGFVLDHISHALSLEPTCAEIGDLGRLLFEHEHTARSGMPIPFQRVQDDDGGPETTACRSCHWRGGPAGAGALVDNAFLHGDGDTIGSAQARNPPPLLGLALVELLGKERGVQPFGWRGEFATLRAFIADSAHNHFGVQMRPEHIDAIIMYLARLELPTVVLPIPPRDLASPAEPLPEPTPFEFDDQWADGFALFDDVGCSTCHTRHLVLQRAIYTVAGRQLDLSSQLAWDADLGGYRVSVYSDLEMHDLGSGPYLTRRLWGLNGSGPYLHDGSAPFLDHAIAQHGGEAQFARDAFESLTFEEQGALRIFLMSLRRPWALSVP